MKISSMLLLIGLLSFCSAVAQPIISYQQGDRSFEWDVRADSAKVVLLPGRSVIWQGSLLPAFWLQTGGKKAFIKCELTDGAAVSPTSWQLPLVIGKLGRGHLAVSREDWGIRFSMLEIEWTGAAPAIVEMYFGASDKAVKGSPVQPTWDRPFLPDWQAFGFCVPGAKEGPAQSYFRMWDFGLTNIALGSYGPSTGTPYGAAYPKPVYFAGMGNGDGFVAAGAGSIPDAAMSFRVQSTRGCLQYLYNEDIWGALPGRKRSWADPLRISLGATAYGAFKNYYRSFPARAAGPLQKPAPLFNTWGLWRERKYEIAPLAALSRQMAASMLVLDDGWESSQGSGIPSAKRFPNLDAELSHLRDSGMTYGIWETLGWIDDTAAAGLGRADLIVDRHGRPCKANWSFDPTGSSYYCLDISSAKSREFLRQRTLREMRTLKPSLFKLDFGYGYPSPAMGVPRNPMYRGDRQFIEMVKLIAAAARSVDPTVTIMYYSISPLWMEGIDMVSLDDQGDLWYDIKGGHGEWSVWASLLSDRNIAISGSSGYDWATDDEVILNTAIIGSPGAVLPITGPGGKTLSTRYVNRRLAINKWYRKTVLWEPLWLNSKTGDLNGPPRLNCWGRMEQAGSDSILTALVLRDGAGNGQEEVAGALRSGSTEKVLIQSMRWTGRWALVSQDDQPISSSSRLAVIPFDEGVITIPYPARPAGISRWNTDGASTYDQWEWKDGQVTIRVPEGGLEHTAGFLLRRDN